MRDGDGELVKRDYLRRATAGGYPEALRLDGVHRDDWFDSYVETVVEREAPAISASPRTAELPRLVRSGAVLVVYLVPAAVPPEGSWLVVTAWLAGRQQRRIYWEEPDE